MKSYSNLRFMYDSMTPGAIDPQVLLMCESGNYEALDLESIIQQYKSAKCSNSAKAIEILEHTLCNINNSILQELED